MNTVRLSLTQPKNSPLSKWDANVRLQRNGMDQNVAFWRVSQDAMWLSAGMQVLPVSWSAVGQRMIFVH
jgi:hypothetical protein